MNKQEKESWASALSVVLSGFFQTCPHDLEDQMLIIALATNQHGVPLFNAVRDAINESADTHETVALKYSETAERALDSLCDNSSTSGDPPSFTGTAQSSERAWHVVLKYQADT